MRRAGSIALGVLLLVAVLFVTRTAPTVEQRMGNIATSGRIGELVDTRGFKLRVERVRLAKQVISTSYDAKPVATKGVWLVVTATLIGDWKATSYDNARLTTPDGRVYHTTSRLLNTELLTEDVSTEPGIPLRGAIVFEIPPDALAGSVLRVAKGLASGSRLGPEAAVDLRISEADVRRLMADASPRLTLPKTELGR
jgi:hypothetical protein